jgi:PAS domain S-box-containing protein
MLKAEVSMKFDELSNRLKALDDALEELHRSIQSLPLEHRNPLSRPLELLRSHLADLHTAETAFDEAEQYLRAIYENIKDFAIFTLDLNNRITSWNTGAERIFGFTEAEALAKSGAIIFTPEDRERGEPEKEIQQALEKGFAEDERWHIRKDGSRFFASGVMRQMLSRSGELRGFIKIARDVTQRVQVEAAEREQRIIAESLHEIAIVLSGTLDLDEVLRHILNTVRRVVPHDASNILLIEKGIVARAHSKGYGESDLAAFEMMLARNELLVERIAPFHQMMETRQPTVVDDLQKREEWRDVPLTASMCAYLSMPILATDGVIGLLNLGSRQPGFFNDHHVNALRGFASHAAIAIRNAQLYIAAQELAALEERQHLARDLHDAVTQTLFTASIISEALPQLWEQSSTDIRKQLVLLSRLNRGALSEMRTLLLQLRPANLLTTRLSVLLRQLVDAVQGRKDIAVSLDVSEERELPPDVHVALFRIAQEALNNISKHSQAERAGVNLKFEGGQVELRIRDNGRGFDPDQNYSGMGLQMIRERVAAIAASLDIKNLPGGGTEIMVVWPSIAQEAAD